ncbi:MAG: metallophosphoesterase [Caldilineaceae bacterium]|nr:metallophosphoesterase [Caldilineaceae bacterium]
MKALILSDIHSNIYALEAIWRAEHDSDLIYCAGDLVDYGPYPKEVIQWMRSHQVACVQGNHDAWVVHNYREGRIGATIPVAERAWVHHNASLLDDDDIAYLAQLPKAITFALDTIFYGMTHLYQDYNEIVSRHAYQHFLDQLVGHERATAINRLIMGHTHRQSVRYLSDARLWLNPGSVSYRRRDDPDQSAHYAVIVDGVISLRQVAYELTPLRTYVAGVSLKASELDAVHYFFGER